MVSGDYPANVEVDPAVEPLCYHLPRLLGSIPRITAEARREFCDKLVLRQDDAWLALIRQSAVGAGGVGGGAVGGAVGVAAGQPAGGGAVAGGARPAA